VVNWLHSPSIVSLLLVTCAAAALVTGDLRGRDPPTALVFGLLIGFLAAGVWSNSWNAQQAVDSEASALRWSTCSTATSQPPTSGGWIC
jgi:hypothetical protein